MTCHVSVLSPGHCPHPPHSHIEEELLIILDGEGSIEIAANRDDASPRVEMLIPGQFSYYPAWQHHTIRNRSTRPVTYMMFKWTGTMPGRIGGLPAGIFDYRSQLAAEDARAFAPSTLLNSPTGWLNRLHCHVTRLKPGIGYAPHIDNYDVAIVMLAGKVETIGQVLQPCDVVFYGAGEMHGMKSLSSETSKYLVFEFER
jgi:quercetin dioxygenase-like cupin family protein